MAPDGLGGHALGAFAAALRPSAAVGDPRGDRLERLIGARAVGAPGLGEIWAPAPPLPPNASAPMRASSTAS